MDNPVKFNWVIKLRDRADQLLIFLPLPNLNPNIVSMLSVLAMMMIFFVSNLYQVLFFVILSIFLDWLDGTIARKYNRINESGYIIDALCDRASEGVIAIVLFYPWFYLFVLNLILLFISWQRKINLLMPLRLIFLLVIILKIFGINLGLI